jgi:hypothetical protein
MLVFIEANVWYPVVLADLVLRSVEIGLFDLAWTDESLAEVERVLVEHKGLSAANAAVFGAQVRATAPLGRIEPAAYRPLISAMTGPDPGDYVHAAAARGGRTDVLLTSNVADFPAADVGPTCRVLHGAGDLFGELAATYPIELGRVIAEMAAHRHRPPMTPEDILDRLDAQGLHVMVSELRPSGPTMLTDPSGPRSSDPRAASRRRLDSHSWTSKHVPPNLFAESGKPVAARTTATTSMRSTSRSRDGLVGPGGHRVGEWAGLSGPGTKA